LVHGGLLTKVKVENQNGALSILHSLDKNFIFGWLFLTGRNFFLRVLKPSAYL
jgi:hypothetical protein